jgi:Ni/Co efflux regulator RcnB
MRPLLRSFAIVAALVFLTGGGALAREHDGGGEQHGGHRGEGHGSEGRGGDHRGGGERGAPPSWARSGGRWERGPGPEAYGPPPGAYLPPRYYPPRRGGYLPPQARGGVVQDYGRYRLRPPPRGYAWVRSGRATMLMDMNTGQVFDVIPD